MLQDLKLYQNCVIKRGYRVIQKVANINKITHPTCGSNFNLGDQKINLPNFSPFFIKNVIKIRTPPFSIKFFVIGGGEEKNYKPLGNNLTIAASRQKLYYFDHHNR